MLQTAPAAKTSAQPNTMTGLAGWVEVFRAGDHVDSKGRAISFSRADLQQMADNQALGAAPAVLGHPKHNAPAYAWTEGFKVDGDSLFTRFEQINPAFEAGVKSGAYRNRSVSVFRDKEHGWRVRHVGWLGAEPPALDGLAPVEFSADEADDACFEFSAPGYSLVWGLEAIAKLLRGLREQAIARDGIEAADAALPQWQIDSAMEAAATARREFEEQRTTSFSHPGDPMSTITQEQLEAARTAAAAEARTAAQAEFSAAQTELAQLRAERRNERLTAQVKGWVAEGKVLPAEQPGLVEFMASLEAADAAQFSFSAAGATVEKTPGAWFAEFMAARKPVVQLGKRSDNDESIQLDKGDHVAIAEAAREFQASEAKAGRVISIEAAVSHVAHRS